MPFRLGFKDFKRNLFMNLLIILLLAVVFLTAISIVSAVQIKFKKYRVLEPYLSQNGVYLRSVVLQCDGCLLRDEAELREKFPNMKDILSVEEVWEPVVNERDKRVNAWCYSEAVIDMLSPEMIHGRWFQASDNVSDVLKAVVSYNDDNIKTGDKLTLSNTYNDDLLEIEIIGVMQDNASLFNTDGMQELREDYRDCLYTYNYEAEARMPLLIFSDAQILAGQENGYFSNINFRMHLTGGFQKQMSGATVITYEEDVSKEEIDKYIEILNQESFMDGVFSLSEVNQNSIRYVFSELKSYFPVFICVFIFVIFIAVSANTVTVKKQLKNYAIYSICGLSWTNCAKISLCQALITSGIAFGMVVFSMVGLKVAGLLENTALSLGVAQIGICFIIILCYVLLAWSIPRGIMKRTSAKEIMTNNR